MKKIKLNNGMIARVDDDDFDKINKYKWFSQKIRYTTYARTTLRIGGVGWKKNVSMHRMILGLKRGDGKYTDHKDGDGLNNQKENLRIATNQQNSWNRKNYKGYLGVSRCRDGTNQYRTRVDNTQYGQYKDDKIAALVYDKIVRKLRGEFASLNFPNERLPKDFKIPNFNSEPSRAEHSSGVQGVVWHKVKQKWRIVIKGKNLGYFTNLEDAIKKKNGIIN